jgi:hypothetical protein
MASENVKTVIGLLSLILGLGLIFITLGIVAIGVPSIILLIGGIVLGLTFTIAGGWTTRRNW